MMVSAPTNGYKNRIFRQFRDDLKKNYLPEAPKISLL